MKQLLKQIYNEYRSNAFIWVELLLVFVVLWYIVDTVYITLRIYCQPMGFDIENTYILRVNRLTDKSAEFNPDLTVKDDVAALKEIADRLSQRPDVEAVCLSQNSIPYNNGSNLIGFRFHPKDTIQIRALRRWTTPEYYRVFRFRNIDGSGSESLAKAMNRNSIITTVDVADRYPEATFHGKDILGREAYFYDGDEPPLRVTALTEPARYDHFTSAGIGLAGTYIGTFLSDEQIESFENVGYLELSLRVREGQNIDFVDRLMNDVDRLYQVGNIYILDISPMSDIQTTCEIDSVNELKTQFCILFFLLLNIFLGIIGTFWFRTQQRRGEVALRMALGADRWTVFCRLITEGLLLLSMAAIPAIVITFNIGYSGLVDDSQLPFTISRFLLTILLTYIMMVLMILLGIWFPAHQAIRISPAEALHEE